MKPVVCLSMFLFLLGFCKAELVPLWTNHEEGKEVQRYYIDTVRLAGLKEIDLLKTKPNIDLQTAVKVAMLHLERENPEAEFIFSEAIFYKTEINKKSISLYEVRIFPKEGHEISGSSCIHVLLDGKILKSMTEKKWSNQNSNKK